MAAGILNGSSVVRVVLPLEQRGALTRLLEGALTARKGGGDVWEWALKRCRLLQAGMSEEVLLGLLDAGLLAQQGYDVALTTEGVDWALGLNLAPERQSCVGPTVVLAARVVPVYDRNGRRLYFEGRLVKRFRQHAENQEKLVLAFEADHWAHAIKSPLSWDEDVDPKERLRDTLRRLNQGHQEARLHFFLNGDGLVWWEPYGGAVPN
jgi:hypothetical protein